MAVHKAWVTVIFCYLRARWEDMQEHWEASAEKLMRKPIKKIEKKKLSNLFGWAGHKHGNGLKEATHSYSSKNDVMSELNIRSNLT